MLAGGLVTDVTLIDERHFHPLSRDLLNGARQFRHLSTFGLIGRGYQERQQMAQGIDGQWTLLPCLRL